MGCFFQYPRFQQWMCFQQQHSYLALATVCDFYFLLSLVMWYAYSSTLYVVVSTNMVTDSFEGFGTHRSFVNLPLSFSEPTKYCAPVKQPRISIIVCRIVWCSPLFLSKKTQLSHACCNRTGYSRPQHTACIYLVYVVCWSGRSPVYVMVSHYPHAVSPLIGQNASGNPIIIEFHYQWYSKESFRMQLCWSVYYSAYVAVVVGSNLTTAGWSLYTFDEWQSN